MFLFYLKSFLKLVLVSILLVLKNSKETFVKPKNNRKVLILDGNGNPCRGLVQCGNNQHETNVGVEHANPSGHCGNRRGWWKIIQR